MPFLLINKPSGITSHDVIDRIRTITNERTVGHAGTLDPFATGLLIVGVSRSSTKRLSEFLKLDKSYRAVAYLGKTSDTHDVTGIITIKNSTIIPSEETIIQTFSNFSGTIAQIPPMHSAKKINGKKMYELARAGITIPRNPVEVTIFSLTLLSYHYPHVSFQTHVSSGTYIRTLTFDIGQQLQCGAYLNSLERTAIGAIQLTSAVTLSELTSENWQSFTHIL